MRLNDKDMERKTREYLKQTTLESPPSDFTAQVMNKVEKEKVYGKNWKENNLWQILIAVGLPLLYFAIQYAMGDAQVLRELINDFASSSYFSYLKVFSDSIIQDVTVSPIVFLGIIAIVILLAFDKFVIKMLHSH